MSETLRKFLLIVAAVFGVLAFIFIVGLCTMASAADIPVAQRVKVMDGDTLSSNIIGTSAHPFFDNAIQSGVWSLRLNDGSGTLIGSVGDALKVNVTNSFAAGVPDKTTFAYGTTIQNSIGGVYQDTSPSVTAGQAGAVRITALRGLHVNLRDASGNEAGLAAAPLSMQNIVSGVAVDPRARTWTLASGTDGVTALQGTAAALSGAWPAKITDGTNTMPTMDVVGRAGFQKITDGTNVQAVKAASTAVLATDPSAVVALSPNSPLPSGQSGVIGAVNQGTNPWTDKIKGDSDGTLIGNVADRLKVDNGGIAASMFSRTDESATLTTSGNTAALDTAGMMAFSADINVTAASGTTPTLEVALQQSDDQSHWESISETPQFTTTGNFPLRPVRVVPRYYRYAWTISGTTPSFTVSIVTTAKSISTDSTHLAFRYSDIDLSVNGNASSTFKAMGCSFVSVMTIRAAGGANATAQVFGSNDNANFMSVSGNLAINPATNNGITLTGLSWRYYQVQVTSHAGVGTMSNIFWSCN